ncbi:MAG: peptide chain release factor 2 [Candidatus Paceibacterota bacterium]
MLVTIDQIQELSDETQSFLQTANRKSWQEELDVLQQASAKPGFWDQPQAQTEIQRLAWLQHRLDSLTELGSLLDDLQAFTNLNAEEQAAFAKEANKNYWRLEKLLTKLKLEKYLSGKYDSAAALLSIHPGQGGTEAMDWAEMLSRMYARYFERTEWKYSLISEVKGEEAGIKEVIYEIQAPLAYGYLKHEQGTHRLVRLSPFNADNLRQTSFALVEVTPLIEDTDEIELKDADLEWHFTRSGGAGGQNVNKVNTAVELKHLPSGVAVRCREERSQAQNREKALKMLKSRLAIQAEEERQQTLAKEKGEHTNASWGTQIRNYVLHPYQLVKDTRTKVETTDSAGVLDGDLEQFIVEEIKLG